MPRTNLKVKSGMKASEVNLRRMWLPLRLDDVDNPQNALDRQSVLDVIRSVYDPLLTAWLAEPGHTWQNQFSARAASSQFREQVIARMRELPSGVQSIESEAVLGEILYDILRFYRFTDPAWRVPTPGTAVASPAPAPAAAAALAPARPRARLGPVLRNLVDGAIATRVVTAGANLEVLADAANQVLAPTATANPANPLDVLAEAACSAEPNPVASPTEPLDILAAAASTLPYAPTPAPATAAGPIESPAPGTKRGRDDESEDESELPDKKKQAK
ncbi:hypothetical protein N7519_007486 [Penicillium mononematosum]|uniref:uncharacterized protein n=1 Tax=Penicillium mononematosum TaxID=268346 RepID=UPI002547FCF3|nr:uncharacterized protein N7519_007486 [Penicillium mononematosum]KAJ6186185.1 hypothetical protein N7519_007486 [Penicillium mononematosum]